MNVEPVLPRAARGDLRRRHSRGLPERRDRVSFGSPYVDTTHFCDQNIVTECFDGIVVKGQLFLTPVAVCGLPSRQR